MFVQLLFKTSAICLNASLKLL